MRRGAVVTAVEYLLLVSAFSFIVVTSPGVQSLLHVDFRESIALDPNLKGVEGGGGGEGGEGGGGGDGAKDVKNGVDDEDIEGGGTDSRVHPEPTH